MADILIRPLEEGDSVQVETRSGGSIIIEERRGRLRIAVYPEGSETQMSEVVFDRGWLVPEHETESAKMLARKAHNPLDKSAKITPVSETGD